MKRLIPIMALLSLLACQKAFGQGLLPFVEGQFFGTTGAPLAAGKICTTVSGTSTNLATYPTYADAVASTNANANPVVLDSAGRANIWIRDGSAYRISIYTSGTGNTCNGSATGTLVKTVDGVASGTSVINATTINGVQMCDQYPGATAGAKIAACMAALPSTGGIADANGIQGAVTIPTDVFNSVTKPVQLLLSGATYGFTLATTIPANISITLSQGAILSPATGKTLTIQGPVAAPPVKIFANAASGQGTIGFSGNSSVTALYPEWWGVLTTNSAAVNTPLLQAAITAAPPNSRISITNGQYLVGGEISMAGKSNLTIDGTSTGFGAGNVSTLTWTPTVPGTRSGLSLLGAVSIVIRDLNLYSGDPTNAPKAVLILGRSSAGSFGLHRFERINVTGYATLALVYSIASEENSWDNVNFSLDGGGGKYVFYTAQDDFLSLGGFTGGTNLSFWFHHFKFSNSSVVANSAAIYIEGQSATGQITFRDGFLAETTGSYVQINVHNDADDIAEGAFVFDAVRAENYSTVAYGFRLTTDAGTVLPTVARLAISDCSFLTATNFLLASDTVRVWQSKIVRNFGGTSSVPMSFYDVQNSWIFSTDVTVTVRNATDSSVIWTPSSSYLFTSVADTNNLVFNNGITRAASFVTPAISTASGNLDVTPAAGSSVDLNYSTNAEKTLLVENVTNGNAASSGIRLTANSGTSALLRFAPSHATYPSTLFLVQPASNPLILATNDTPRITIAGSGAVTIAGATTFSAGLTVSTTLFASALTAAAGTPNSICQDATSKEVTVNAALTCTVSARDQKNSIQPLLRPVELFQKLNPVEFQYNDSPRQRWGFIADEVQAVDHALGDAYTVKDEARSIDANAILALTVKALQEANRRLDVLQMETADLEKRLTAVDK